jgi:hypothetical protein
MDNEKSILPISPKRLITLWDMIKVCGLEVWAMIFALGEFEKKLKADFKHGGPLSVVSSERMEELNYLLTEFKKILTNFEMDKALSRINHLELILRKRCLSSMAAGEILGLQSQISDEARERYFAFIPKSKVDFFEKEDLFGGKVSAAFVSAKPEIKAAGNCLACDLNTAAVFHLMRVVEFGMRGLASNLNVKIPKKPLELAGWDEMIQKIDEKISKKLNRKAPLGVPLIKYKSRKGKSYQKKEEDKEFYRGVIHEFYGFKDVWRNHVMHTRKSYNPQEAEGVFWRVRDFMQKLATRISESH